MLGIGGGRVGGGVAALGDEGIVDVNTLLPSAVA